MNGSLKPTGRRRGMVGPARCAVAVVTVLAIASFAAITTSAAPASTTTSSVRTFESEPIGEPPAACSAPGNTTPALVSDLRGHQSERSLRINDPSADAHTAIACPVAAQHGANLKFAAYPAALPNGFLVSLLGHLEGIEGAPRLAFHLNVSSDGRIQWYDALGWTQVAPPGAVPTDRWSTIRVQVPTDQHRAHIYVDGTYVGDGGPAGVRAVADITGYQFAGNGTATQGDDVFIDNVSLGAADDSPPPGGAGQFAFGPHVTIDQSDGPPLQMPYTAVNVPTDDGGANTLVTYSAHGDATHETGTRVSSSADQGTTWEAAQALNPMPDEQSFYYSRLRNGDLLAVSYHTFMTPGSDNHQADVPTAISHDGGRTWTQRTGTMTTPQRMRPISPATSRPGHPLGGFVLVHSVVEDPDGTLYQSGYGFYEDDPKARQVVLKSTDGGINWTTTTVAVDPTLSDHPRYEGFDEGAIERVADGSLLIVMRTGSYQPMYVSRSTDDGATWSTPQPLLAGPDSQPVVGIFPSLILMPNGKLILYIGRPGQSMLVSPDGNGHDWTRPVTVDYLNSGNGNALAIGPHRLLAFGDRGADWNTPRPAEPRIWSRTVDLARPCTTTVTGYHAGPLQVSSGTTCLDHATVSGPVTVQAGTSLIVSGSTLQGPVHANGARTFTICDSRVQGPVTVTGTTGAVMIGDRTHGCAAPKVDGPIKLSRNSGLVITDPADEHSSRRS